MLVSKNKNSNKVFKTRFDDSLGSHVTIEMEENGVTTQFIDIKQKSDHIKTDLIEVEKPFYTSFYLGEISRDEEVSGKVVNDGKTYKIIMWRTNLKSYLITWLFSFFVDEKVAKILSQWFIDLNADKNATICQTYNKNEWKKIILRDTEGYGDLDFIEKMNGRI